MQLAVTRALARIVTVGALLAPLAACVSELLVEVQPPASTDDAGLDAAPDPGIEPPDAGPMEGPDAGQVDIDTGIVNIGPADDVFLPEAGSVDAGVDASAKDAAADSGPIVVLEAGADAGCTGAACDAGFIPGPCAGGCDVTTLVTPACDDGGHQVCWGNADGTCSFQCPAVRRCSPSVPCAADEWCFFENHDCGDTVPFGYCAKRRPTCEDSGFGVCGCDGVSYPNGCLANQAGTSVRAGGVCK